VTPYVLPVLLASVAGSLHCAAMCGPFLAAVAGDGSHGRSGVASHAAYHVGRLVTYAALGGVGGLVGGAVDGAGIAVGIGRISALAAGLVLIVYGVSAFVPRSGLVRLRRRAPSRLGAVLGRVLAAFSRLPAVPRAFLLGLSTTLVPCGWLYAFVATAAGTGGVVSGLGVMLAFWVGTLPALVAGAFGLRGLLARVGARGRAVSAALVAVSGVLLLAWRVEAASPFAGKAASAPGAAAPASCPLHPH